MEENWGVCSQASATLPWNPHPLEAWKAGSMCIHSKAQGDSTRAASLDIHPLPCPVAPGVANEVRAEHLLTNPEQPKAPTSSRKPSWVPRGAQHTGAVCSAGCPCLTRWCVPCPRSSALVTAARLFPSDALSLAVAAPSDLNMTTTCLCLRGTLPSAPLPRHPSVAHPLPPPLSSGLPYCTDPHENRLSVCFSSLSTYKCVWTHTRAHSTHGQACCAHTRP